MADFAEQMRESENVETTVLLAPETDSENESEAGEGMLRPVSEGNPVISMNTPAQQQQYVAAPPLPTRSSMPQTGERVSIVQVQGVKRPSQQMQQQMRPSQQQQVVQPQVVMMQQPQPMQ